jgi:hypothetical protein
MTWRDPVAMAGHDADGRDPTTAPTRPPGRRAQRTPTHASLRRPRSGEHRSSSWSSPLTSSAKARRDAGPVRISAASGCVASSYAPIMPWARWPILRPQTAGSSGSACAAANRSPRLPRASSSGWSKRPAQVRRPARPTRSGPTPARGGGSDRVGCDQRLDARVLGVSGRARPCGALGPFQGWLRTVIRRRARRARPDIVSSKR